MSAEQASSASSGQARIGRNYDRWVAGAPMGRFYAWLASVPGSMLFDTPVFKLHEELQLHPENRVLDVGCGRASLLQVLCARVPFQRPPVGIDLSRGMLRLGAEARDAELLQATGTRLPQATGTRLPLSPESFDVVTCSYITQHLDDGDLLDLLAEVRRVLKPGGIALVWDFAPTRSRRLNAFHARVLEMGIGFSVQRGPSRLGALALQAGFEWVSNAHLRPFLFPPIPRASVIIGKAPIGWQPNETQQGLIPDTRSRSIVADVKREQL